MHYLDLTRDFPSIIGKPAQPMSLRRFPLYFLLGFFLHLQPILKGLPGDTDHVADADRLEQPRVGEFIGRGAADTENGCDVIHGVCPALGRSFFVGCVGIHKIILPLC